MRATAYDLADAMVESFRSGGSVAVTDRVEFVDREHLWVLAHETPVVLAERVALGLLGPMMLDADFVAMVQTDMSPLGCEHCEATRLLVLRLVATSANGQEDTARALALGAPTDVLRSAGWELARMVVEGG